MSGRDRTWTPLPPLVMAQWSSDENRILYVSAERENGHLLPRSISLLTGKQSEQICDINRVGEITLMALPDNGETAFLLAGPEAGLQIWMMALPRAAQPQSAR